MGTRRRHRQTRDGPTRRPPPPQEQAEMTTRGARRRGQGEDVGMEETRAEIVDVIFDCSDPNRVASFWAEVLGRAIAGSKGPYVWLERVDGGSASASSASRSD